MTKAGYIVSLDDYFWNQTPFMSVYYALFTGLFLGTEYSDGTIRNKIAAGHRRTDIYLANFITCFFAGIVYLLIWWICSVPGFFLIGPLDYGIAGFLVYAFIAVGFTAVFMAIFTWISMLSSNKALTIVFVLLAWLGMLFAASACYDRLLEPEMGSSLIMTIDGLQQIDPEPNPLYVSGTARTVLECVLDALPTGQAQLMADNAITHPLRQILFSILIFVLTVPGGMATFKKKDLK